jgi:hypothetical protein
MGKGKGQGRDQGGEGGGSLGSRSGRTNLILEALETCPPAHHERVVGREDSDGVDTLSLELVVLLEVGREVVCVARWLWITSSIN